MSDTIQISTNALDLLRRFERLPKELQTGVKKGLGRGLLLVEDRVRANSRLKSRRGAAGLMGRLTSFVTTYSGTHGVDGVIGFRRNGRGFPYELSQEYGAKAKPGKAMAMPVTAQARRYPSPRQFPRKLFIPPHMAVLAEPYARGGGIKAIQYVLLKSIPPRLNFRKTVLASGDVISREVEAAAGREMGA